MGLWGVGGRSDDSNSALVCRPHHRAVHEGYTIERHADGELKFHRPDGRLLPEVPSPVAGPKDPVHALYTRHSTQGLQIRPRTALPGWLGERLDAGYAVAVMHPLAQEPPPP